MNQENNDTRRAGLAAKQTTKTDSASVNSELVEAWLSVLKQYVPALSACVVTLDGAANRFEWRQKNDANSQVANLDNLRAAAALARRSRRIISTHDRHHLTLAGQISTGGKTGAVYGSYAIACDESRGKQIQIQTELERSSDWFAQLLARFRLNQLHASSDLPWALFVLGGSNLSEKLQCLVNQVVERGSATRVAIGLAAGRKVGRINISGQREFAKRSPLQHRLRTEMQTAINKWADCGAYAPQITDHGLTLQIPLLHAERLVGVLLLDRRDGAKFSEAQCDSFANQGSLLGAMIDLAQSADRDPVNRLQRFFAANIPSSGKSKLLIAGLLLAALGAALFPTTQKITAESRIEGKLQRALVAPMETYLDKVHAEAGQLVNEGDLLATFATEDLSLERLKWQSERARKIKAKRDAAARQERAKLGVLEAEIAQANAEIALVESKIERTDLRSPVTGVIVSGDLSQRLGAPVEKGEVLFEVVPDSRYQLTLLFSEQDIKQIEVGLQGYLKLNAFPAKTLPIEVVRITPVNEITATGNYFVAYAAIDQHELAITPGMRGISKIELGKRPSIMNWTRSFRRWVSLKWWQLFGA
ncbi:MAG: HlyD family efflux transporter periplasmic adaptor subunit [Pseudomonadota bacterium]